MEAFPYHHLLLVFFYGIYVTEALNGTVELIHRDSPKSPFYNSSETPYQRLTNAIHRSFYRLNHFHQLSEVTPPPQAEINHVVGEYLMKYYIGTPLVDVMAIMDTGSDLIWLQCQPCNQCYQETTPFFDPSKSTSYESVLCSSNPCKLVYGHYCSDSTGESKCQYNITYAGGTHSNGDVAFDTFSLPTIYNTFINFNKALIGCSHNSNDRHAGVVGLGAGATSLTSQMNTLIDYKFSYCLGYGNNKLNFGSYAVVSGPGTVTTPLASGPVHSFYYLTLEGITVGGAKRLDLVDEANNNTGVNVVIDSGTTLTFLPEEIYARLEADVAAQIKSKRAVGTNPRLNLCYNDNIETIEVPVITAHFAGGADIVLNRNNTLIGHAPDLVCLAFSPSTSFTIFGNMAQINFLVGYDRQKNTVSFKPTDCSSFW